RSIAAIAGILVTPVLVTKETPAKLFAGVVAAMNDLLRPSLYQSWMNIRPVVEQPRETKTWDIVGPVCESSDFLGKERELGLSEGDLLCIFSAGAYGFSMSSNYNSRTRAAEIMVSGDRAQVTRERESLDDLIVGEHRFRLERG
ncbi:MAG: diaminopimelate decarboxylase, partial [Pseudomonadales bacterium]